MATAVFCIATDTDHAERIVNELKEAGFNYSDISVRFPDTSGSGTIPHEQHTRAPNSAAAGAGTGGVVGGALGLLTGLGALAIPGLGPFIAAGPVAAALGGAAVGATLGGVAGALVGMGISEHEAKRYQDRVKSGKILISVHTEDRAEMQSALEILECSGAQHIATSSERSTYETEKTKRQR